MKISVIFLAAIACATGFGSVNAAVPQAATQKVQPKKYSVKKLEKRMNAHHAKMVKEGRESELSDEFLAVHKGMKKGNYQYDFATIRTVMRDVLPKRAPLASPRLHRNQQ